MLNLINTSFTAIFSFVATNVDDLIINILFCSQLRTAIAPEFRFRHIVAGKYLGLSLLVLASLPGFVGGLLIPQEWIGLLGVLPIVLGLRMLLLKFDNSPEFQGVHANAVPRSGSWWTSLLSWYTYEVAAVTVANGGDNIGIYLPLFASLNVVQLGITVLVFWIMIGLWCGLSYYFARHSAIAQTFAKYGHRVVPFLLILLGMSILVQSGTYRLLG
ncbi:cadmium resistance transporter [Leptolyngbya sp. AN02str]|uniref:cadmium resistance transporter n=1 Tax=Leptolyngbya sp. AN02str TaxID=3423363 RepID=UPI003D310560